MMRNDTDFLPPKTAIKPFSISANDRIEKKQ